MTSHYTTSRRISQRQPRTAANSARAPKTTIEVSRLSIYHSLAGSSSNIPWKRDFCLCLRCSSETNDVNASESCVCCKLQRLACPEYFGGCHHGSLSPKRTTTKTQQIFHACTAWFCLVIVNTAAPASGTNRVTHVYSLSFYHERSPNKRDSIRPSL